MMGLKNMNRRNRKRSASPPQMRRKTRSSLNTFLSFPMNRGGTQQQQDQLEQDQQDQQQLRASPISYFLLNNPQYISNEEDDDNNDYYYNDYDHDESLSKNKTRQARMDLTI